MPNVIDSRVQTDAKAFDGLIQAFFEFAQSNYADIWTDFNEDQFMTLIAELIAYEGDLLTYYLDKQTSENFLTTAQLRQSVIDIGKMLDYTLASASPAGGEVTFNLDTATFDYLTAIPAGFRVSNGVLTYETVTETNVTPGATSVTIPVIEGETFRQTLAELGIVGTSTGEPNQEFILLRKNIILSNNLTDLVSDLSVTVDGVQYTPVFNIITAQSTDKQYVVNTDEDNITTIKFGNGIFGQIPALGTQIEAVYRALLVEREENSFGNVNANTITTLVDTRTGILTVTNAEKLTGGRAEESLEEGRANIPKSLKAGNRAVSPEDFVSLAIQFPGVAKAALLKGRSDLDLDLYIAPDGGGLPSQTLKNGIVAYFESRKMVRTKVFPRDPFYQPVSINLRIQAAANNRNQDVKTNVENALSALFSFDNMDFGRAVFLKSTGGSDIYDLNETIEGVSGIDHVKYNKVTLKPAVYNKKFTNSGVPSMFMPACTVRSMATRKEYEAVMQNTTEFLLKAKEFGRSTSLNDTRLEDNLKTFLLDSGTSTNISGGNLTDSTQFWQDNEFQYQTLIDSAGVHFIISSNTFDTISVSGAPASGDYQIVRRLAGYYLNPDVDQTGTFLILDNDANSITVDSGLSEVAVIGNRYEFYRYETNKFDPDAHLGTADGVSSSTDFSDNSTIGDGDDFYNDMYVIFQEGPAANIPVKVLNFVSSTGSFTTQSLGVGIQPDVTDRYVVAPAYKLGVTTTVISTPAPSTTQFSGASLGGEGNDYYNGWALQFNDGGNAGLVRKVLDYDDTGSDTLTTHAFPNPPVTGDEFSMAKEYQTDDQSLTFAILSEGPSSSDLYIFQVSDLVGDLTPRENQILQIDSADLIITVVGGS